MNNIELKAIEDERKKKNNVRREEVIANIDNLVLTKWNTRRDCDVVITSASRPELLKLTLEYFETNVHFHGNFRFILNEDYVIPKESKKLVEWAANSGYFKKEDIHCNNPPLGLDKSIVKVIDKVKTPFFIYLQDDWCFERPIELDKVIYIMEKIPQVNNILFYKYKVPYALSNICFREYYFRQFPQFLTLYPTWEFIPGIWRYDFIEPIIEKAMKKEQRTAPARLTHYIRDPSKREDYDFLFNNMGVFMWGGHGEPRWVRHIGENCRVESWRMSDDGKPGKENGITQEKNVIQMAEWLPFEHIPKIKGRNSIKLIKENLIRRKMTIQ